MTPRHRCAGLLPVVLLVLASPARATQIDIARWKPDPSHHASYDAVRERHGYLVDTFRFDVLFTHLQRELTETPAWSKNEPVYLRLSRALAILVDRFRNFDAEVAARDPAQAVDDFLGRYPTGLFQHITGKGWFRDDFFVADEEVEALPTPQGEDFLHRVNAVQRLLTDLRRPSRQRALDAIQRAAAAWRAYVFRGRSQYPWEMAVNGSAIGPDSDLQHPPRRQWVLLHPELGVEIGTGGSGAANLTAKETLTVHMLGHVWYRRWEELSDEIDPGWWGLSGTVSLREDLRPGVGFIVHYGRVLNVGAAWHDVDRNGNPFDDTPYVLAGIDLYRLARKNLPDAFMKRVRSDTERIDKLTPP